MTRPESYARRIRARPYGPRELASGGVAAWFHGPFAVLTLTDGETALIVRADLDAPSLGTDLLQMSPPRETRQPPACHGPIGWSGNSRSAMASRSSSAGSRYGPWSRVCRSP